MLCCDKWKKRPFPVSAIMEDQLTLSDYGIQNNSVVSAMATVQIFLKTLTDKTVTFDVKLTDNIEAIKKEQGDICDDDYDIGF